VISAHPSFVECSRALRFLRGASVLLNQDARFRLNWRRFPGGNENAAKTVGAFRYATSRWTALTRYLGDGRLEMSNNAAERAMRPLALGRKNYLFAGSDEGGRRAAILYTLTETARLNGVDPEAWLGDVISRVTDHPNTKIDELLPWKWTRAGSQAIAA
jgi:Transposase IS66 family/IS66 C-terminal element